MRIHKISTAFFLSTPDKAFEWAKNNLDIPVNDETNDSLLSDDEINYAKAEMEMYKEKAELYSDKYNDIRNMGAIVVYRVIRVSSLKNINWHEIGTHWSFEKQGAGAYGIVPKEGKDILLTGIANSKDIDWEYSFTSFMYYGESQWECSFNTGVEITITHIDNEKLEHPKISKA